jgi:hypothetical protein
MAACTEEQRLAASHRALARDARMMVSSVREHVAAALVDVVQTQNGRIHDAVSRS